MDYECPPQLLQWLVCKRELQSPPADAGRHYRVEASPAQPPRMDASPEKQEEMSLAVTA